MAWLALQGDGTFQPVGTCESGGYNAFPVPVEDVTADGKQYLVVETFARLAAVAATAPLAVC